MLSVQQGEKRACAVSVLDRFHVVEYVFAPWEWVWCRAGFDSFGVMKPARICSRGFQKQGSLGRHVEQTAALGDG